MSANLGSQWRWPAMGVILGSACIIAIAAVRSATADPITVPVLPKPGVNPVALTVPPPVLPGSTPPGSASPIPVIPPAVPTIPSPTVSIPVSNPVPNPPVQTGLVTIPSTPPVPAPAPKPVLPKVGQERIPPPPVREVQELPLPQGGIEIPGLVAPQIEAGAATPKVPAKSTEPKLTEPKSTEPKLTEPKLTEPKLTEPKLTEPKLTEPKLTEPKPTVPELGPPPVLVPGIQSPASSAQSSQSTKGTQSAMPSVPDFDLRPAKPGLSVNNKENAPVVPQVPAPLLEPAGKPMPAVGDSRKIDTQTPRPELTPTPKPPGDSAMTLPGRQTVLSAAFGLALAVAPTSPIRAQETPIAPTNPASTPAPALTATEVDGLKRDLKQLQADIRRLDDQRLAMDKALFDKKTNGLGADGLTTRVDSLELKVQTLQSTLNRIEDRLDRMSKTTVGSSPLTDNPPPPPSAIKGNVRIVNEYPTEISMVINGFSYRLAPNQVQTVPVPAGSYSYELLGAGSKSQTSTVKEGETVTLRIR